MSKLIFKTVKMTFFARIRDTETIVQIVSVDYTNDRPTSVTDINGIIYDTYKIVAL